MKIIDFEKKGNQVKFYLGDDSLKDWNGDDWNDTPYEHNAGRVYQEFIKTEWVLTFDFDDLVLEPADGAENGNSKWCKDDMKIQKVPCIIVLPKEYVDPYYDYFYPGFDKIAPHSNVSKFYIGDQLDPEKTLAINYYGTAY